MSHRFAAGYLAVRDRLAILLSQVNGLAEKSRTKVEGLLEMRESLLRPLVISVAGDVRVESSQFLGTLLGVKISGGLRTKKTSGVVFKKDFDAEEFDIPLKAVKADGLSELLCVKLAPCDQLQGQEEALLSKWVEKSDVIFWMFSAENPWSATTWGQIEELSSDLLDRSVVILSEIEGHSPEDLEVMLGHMRSLSEQRLCRVLPIVPVSLKKGENEGYDLVWDHANRRMEESSVRSSYLGQVKDKLYRVLDVIEEVMDERSVALEGDQGFLSSLEADIERQREREIQLYAGRGVDLCREFVEEIDPMLTHLRSRCAIVSSTLDLFAGGLLARSVEKKFIKGVTKAFVGRSKADLNKILLNCKEQWRKMQHHLDERLGADAGGFQQEPFRELLPELMQHQGKSAQVAIMSMKLRMTMEYLLVPRRKALKKLLMLALGLAIVAGILGSFNVPPHELPALITLGLSGIAIGVYGVSVLATRRSVVEALAERATDFRADFTESVYEQYQDMIRELFTGYAPMFEAMRRKIADAKMNLEPMQKEHHGLFLELKAVENEGLIR